MIFDYILNKLKYEGDLEKKIKTEGDFFELFEEHNGLKKIICYGNTQEEKNSLKINLNINNKDGFFKNYNLEIEEFISIEKLNKLVKDFNEIFNKDFKTTNFMTNQEFETLSNNKIILYRYNTKYNYVDKIKNYNDLSKDFFLSNNFNSCLYLINEIKFDKNDFQKILDNRLKNTCFTKEENEKLLNLIIKNNVKIGSNNFSDIIVNVQEKNILKYIEFSKLNEKTKDFVVEKLVKENKIDTLKTILKEEKQFRILNQIFYYSIVYNNVNLFNYIHDEVKLSTEFDLRIKGGITGDENINCSLKEALFRSKSKEMYEIIFNKYLNNEYKTYNNNSFNNMLYNYVQDTKVNEDLLFKTLEKAIINNDLNKRQFDMLITKLMEFSNDEQSLNPHLKEKTLDHFSNIKTDEFLENILSKSKIKNNHIDLIKEILTHKNTVLDLRKDVVYMLLNNENLNVKKSRTLEEMFKDLGIDKKFNIFDYPIKKDFKFPKKDYGIKNVDGKNIEMTDDESLEFLKETVENGFKIPNDFLLFSIYRKDTKCIDYILNLDYIFENLYDYTYNFKILDVFNNVIDKDDFDTFNKLINHKDYDKNKIIGLNSSIQLYKFKSLDMLKAFQKEFNIDFNYNSSEISYCHKSPKEIIEFLVKETKTTSSFYDDLAEKLSFFKKDEDILKIVDKKGKEDLNLAIKKFLNFKEEKTPNIKDKNKNELNIN